MKHLIIMIGIAGLLVGCGSPRAGLTIAKTITDGLINTADATITQLDAIRTNTTAAVTAPFKK